MYKVDDLRVHIKQDSGVTGGTQSSELRIPASSSAPCRSEPAQTHVHWVSDAIQPSHPLSSPSPPALNLSQHHDLSNESALPIRWPKYCIFITSWQIDGETVETVTDFIFLGSKITADGDCSHQIKRCLLLGRKAMTNLDSILKSGNIILPTKFHLVKAIVFQ